MRRRFGDSSGIVANSVWFQEQTWLKSKVLRRMLQAPNF